MDKNQNFFSNFFSKASIRAPALLPAGLIPSSPVGLAMGWLFTNAVAVESTDIVHGSAQSLVTISYETPAARALLKRQQLFLKTVLCLLSARHWQS